MNIYQSANRVMCIIVADLDLSLLNPHPHQWSPLPHHSTPVFTKQLIFFGKTRKAANGENEKDTET